MTIADRPTQRDGNGSLPPAPPPSRRSGRIPANPTLNNAAPANPGRANASRLIRRLVRQLTGAPVTLSYLLLLWLANVLTRFLLPLPAQAGRGEVAASASTLSVRPWSLAASAFWVQGNAFYLAASAAVLLAGVALERRLGPRRFAATAVATQLLGIVVAIGLVWGLRGPMPSWSADLMSHRYLGPSAALCGTLMAATAGMPVLWRRRLRTTVPVLLLVLALYEGSFADVVRLAAAAVGILLGPCLFGHPPVFAWPTVSRREARILVALAVVACAIGPVIAGLSPHASGPLSVLRFLFTDIQPVDPQALQQACASPLKSSGCQMLLLQLRAGAGGIFMAILPCFLLLLCADGLRRGRRFAWASTLVVLGGMAVLAGTHIAGALWPAALGTVEDQSMDFQDLGHPHHPLGLVLPLLLPVLLFLLVAGFRHLFPVAAPPGTYLRLVRRALMISLGLAVLYVSLGLALAAGFTPVPYATQFLADVPDRFLPLGFTLDNAPAFFPESVPAVLLYEGTGMVFWAMTGALVLRSFLQPDYGRLGDDPERVRSILRAGEASMLSWMTTWPGNRYWFTAPGTGFVAYRVSSGIALALGPPVGPARECRAAVEGFGRFCSDNGWTPCFYSAGQVLRDVTASMGWGAIEVAQQAIIPLPALTFAGKRFQDIRTALNRARKEGIRAEWTSYSAAPARVRQQIHELSEEWIAEQKLPELGFTLGGVAELQDPEVRCLLALDADQTLHAVTSWLPVYDKGRIAGWTLDLMRRRRNGFRHSMEFLIATAALTLRDEGCYFISLSGVPLVSSVQEADDGARRGARRLLGWVGTGLEPVYGFRSLLAFKNKFAPRYEPLYLLYPDAAALPNTTNAIAIAYLGELSLPRRLSLAAQLLPRRSGANKGSGASKVKQCSE
ncbi:MAG TPA: DUF2156 domain-containing protein [Micrococcaceae bacterium]|jgi:lysylphosphatidylglycerol synthetase-like protein (DUF2156 family)|nr:DUF2156 domain-containing protein [Micrococcaceae bacterium]